MLPLQGSGFPHDAETAYRERTPRRIDTVCRGVFAGTTVRSATHPKSARTYPFRIGPTRNTARHGNTDSDRRTGETQSVPHRQNSHAGPAEQSCGTTAPLPANAGFASTKVSHTPCSRNATRIIGTIPQQQLLTELPGTMTGTQKRQASAIFRATAAAEPHPKGPLRPTPARYNRAWR